MPANSRWDLIRRLRVKVSYSSCEILTFLQFFPLQIANLWLVHHCEFVVGSLLHSYGWYIIANLWLVHYCKFMGGTLLQIYGWYIIFCSTIFQPATTELPHLPIFYNT